MIQLNDGQLLYHGSYTEVRDIDLGQCKHGLDFGRGFYLTSSMEQARSFVRSSVKKAIRMNRVPPDFDLNDGIVNVYRFHSNPGLSIHCFQDADAEWLHYVAANRDASLFPDLIRKFSEADIIGGKIANDNTARTLVLYVDGALGTPGDPETDATVIRMLLPNRLQDQYCFLTDNAISSLEYVRSERYGE